MIDRSCVAHEGSLPRVVHPRPPVPDAVSESGPSVRGVQDLNALVLVRRARSGGGGCTERSYLDFVIDGRSLLDLLGPEARDTCGCLGWGEPTAQADTVRRLGLEAEPSVAGGREPIYVCPECGDLGCGAVTARITASEGVVRWDAFAVENDWDPEIFEPIESADPFTFELLAYRYALGAAMPKPD
ncbi:MAG: hypothetical protein KF703_17655 [Actinobacteria bacterium]|nr:hypothetical protein [Actinomycetota bacterium]